jgi:hypothetical protein
VALATPYAEHLFDIVAICTDPVPLGTIDGGTALMIPITGGTVSGERLSGEVMPGADWAIYRAAGLATVEARYAIKARDGTIIQIFNGATAPVDRSRTDGVMMITAPRFIAPEGPHDWLNHGVYVATLSPDPEHGISAVRIGVFKVV